MNTLSPQLLAQLYGQQSSDPFLTIITVSHTSFGTRRYVNNTEDLISNGETFVAFPFRITLPADDGETQRSAQIEFDNVSLELLDEIRSVTSPMDLKVEMVLASDPDSIQITLENLKLRNINYDRQKIRATISMDDFLNSEVTSERYEPHNFPGLY